MEAVKKEPNEIVRVLNQFVLVKQTMTKKAGVIITDTAKSDADKFNYSFEIVQKGENCEMKFEVGECPIFSEYVKFSGLKVLEKTDEKMVTLVIVHENDIIAIDLDPKTPNKI